MKLSRWILLCARDAWRIFCGKSAKYTQPSPRSILSQVRSMVCTSADFEVLRDAITSSNVSPGPVVILGAQDSSLNFAVCLWKQPKQSLHIFVESGVTNWFSAGSPLIHSLKSYNDVSVINANSVDDLVGKIPASPSIIIANLDVSGVQIQKLLQHATEIGCKEFIGLGYDIKHHETVRAVHEHARVEGGDNLWRVTLEPRVHMEINRASALKSSRDLKIFASDPVERDLVSIIIPTFDSRPYLQEALNDIAHQTHQNWELIVVEDASPETVVDIVDEFRKRVPNNKVIFQRKPTNTGASATRNVALKMATGDLIAFLDSDDRWLPNHLSRKVDLLRTTGSNICYSGVDMFDHFTGNSESFWGPNQMELDAFPQSLFLRNLIQPSGVVMDRSVLDDVGVFDESIFLVEDYDLWLRSVRAGKRFIYDPKITTRYRRNHAGASTKGRMVLCYDGIARVANRNADLLIDDQVRRLVLTKHLVTAGLGHLGHKQSKQNGCNPKVGYDLLKQACKIDPTKWHARRWMRLAACVIGSGTVPIFRELFRQHYKKTRFLPLSIDSRRSA